MRFDFHSIRFEFLAREKLVFPPGQAANKIRGIVGMHLRPHLFAPSSSAGPSGLADPPRAFVIRARNLDGRVIPRGEPFRFDLNVFSSDAAEFLTAFRDAFGPGSVKRTPVSIDLSPRPDSPSHIRVEFLSPTELKHEGGIAPQPDFPVLFARIRDRISTLRAFYGGGPLAIDFARIPDARMTRSDVRHVEFTRRSSRTGQVHPLSGFIGSAEYEGELAEFLPLAEAAQWTGVGRQTVWGKGEIALPQWQRAG